MQRFKKGIALPLVSALFLVGMMLTGCVTTSALDRARTDLAERKLERESASAKLAEAARVVEKADAEKAAAAAKLAAELRAEAKRAEEAFAAMQKEVERLRREADELAGKPEEPKPEEPKAEEPVEPLKAAHVDVKVHAFSGKVADFDYVGDKPDDTWKVRVLSAPWSLSLRIDDVPTGIRLERPAAEAGKCFRLTPGASPPISSIPCPGS